jgi:hypothetical protein
VNNLLDLQDMVTDYSYSNLLDWIDKIMDPDNHLPIKLWQRRVENGRLNEEDFNQLVSELLNE